MSMMNDGINESKKGGLFIYNYFPSCIKAHCRCIFRRFVTFMCHRWPTVNMCLQGREGVNHTVCHILCVVVVLQEVCNNSCFCSGAASQLARCRFFPFLRMLCR